MAFVRRWLRFRLRTLLFLLTAFCLLLGANFAFWAGLEKWFGGMEIGFPFARPITPAEHARNLALQRQGDALLTRAYVIACCGLTVLLLLSALTLRERSLSCAHLSRFRRFLFGFWFGGRAGAAIGAIIPVWLLIWRTRGESLEWILWFILVLGGIVLVAAAVIGMLSGLLMLVYSALDRRKQPLLAEQPVVIAAR